MLLQVISAYSGIGSDNLHLDSFLEVCDITDAFTRVSVHSYQID